MFDYMTKMEIKEEGFTEKMIRELIGEPDQIKPHPMGKTHAPMKLWLEDRVIAAKEKAIDEWLATREDDDEEEWPPLSGLATRDDLIKLGFSKNQIRKLFPKPETVMDGDEKVFIWKVEDIDDIVERNRFRESPEEKEERLRQEAWDEICEEHSGPARRAAATRARKTMGDTMDRAAAVIVKTPEGADDEETVLGWGVSHWESREEYKRDRRAERGLWQYDSSKPDGEGASLDDKRRWAVNFIRHELTEYDEDLFANRGRTGKEDAYEWYRVQVLAAIADAYPFLREECLRQLDTGYGRRR